jgi:UDP-N-acetylmuramoyl-L-alanyl-D-glutamate--2,6-diaminopimelate ligase
MIRLVKTIYHFIVAVFSAAWFGFPGRRLTVIGVTGTDGKTTTTTLIYEVLKAAGLKVSMISSVHAVIAGKSYNTGFHVTTPNAFWVQKYLRQAVDHGDTHMVLEVTSHGIAQHRVTGIPFAVGVLTNVTHEHLDWHKTFEHYMLTKISLLTRAKVAIINRDESEVYERAMPLLRRKKVISYGIRREAKVTPITFPFKTQLPGVFNKYNCLAAIATANSLGVNHKVVRAAIANIEGVVGRMEEVASSPFRVIVDFAHTPNAIDKALKAARTMTRKRLIHVFGSAGLRDKSKRPLMGRASARYADIIVLTEEDYRTENVESIMDEIAQGIGEKKEIHRFPVRADAVAFALSAAKPGDVVIITGKGHEKSLCRGTKEYPWSDQEAVRKGMKKLK